MNVLVTGGAGYVGSHAVKALLSEGHRVTVLDNLTTGHREFVPENLLVVGEISDAEFLSNVFTRGRFQAVMHFAAHAYVGESVTDPAKYYRNNVGATMILLEAMRKFDVRDFVFSSTCATYGIPETLPLTESTQQNPVNPYGRTKWMVEQICNDYAHAYGLRCVFLRYFNAAGADPDATIGEDHSPETHLIPLALDALVGRRDALHVFGRDYDTPDGTCIRDYVHVGDLASGHTRALRWIAETGRTDAFNLGSESGFSVLQVLETIERVTGRRVPTVDAPRREGDPPRLVADSSLARRMLDWRPQFSKLETIIETAWRWHQRRFTRST